MLILIMDNVQYLMHGVFQMTLNYSAIRFFELFFRAEFNYLYTFVLFGLQIKIVFF